MAAGKYSDNFEGNNIPPHAQTFLIRCWPRLEPKTRWSVIQEKVQEEEGKTGLVLSKNNTNYKNIYVNKGILLNLWG